MNVCVGVVIWKSLRFAVLFVEKNSGIQNLIQRDTTKAFQAQP